MDYCTPYHPVAWRISSSNKEWGSVPAGASWQLFRAVTKCHKRMTQENLQDGPAKQWWMAYKNNGLGSVGWGVHNI